MSALAKDISPAKESTSVTKISANARIDYILRFSKQAVLVVDEASQSNSDVASQFLATLPEQNNIAFVALSSQFNDIQVRCRIIEQLFHDDLFDPEVSLAVSITNFAKQKKQAITIAIDNGQFSSLQILHELSQLALIAKKSGLNIDVVIFSSPLAGQLVAANKSLFTDKLAILSAQSGQILSLNHSLFKPVVTWRPSFRVNKWLLALFIFIFAISSIVIVLLKQDNFLYSNALVDNAEQQVPSLKEVIEQPTLTVIDVNNSSTNEGLTQQKTQFATANDILTALTGERFGQSSQVTEIAASPEDIVNAMLLTESTTVTAIENESIQQASESKQTLASAVTVPKKSDNANVVPNNDYFQQYNQGYVIQLAAFTQLDLPSNFVGALQKIEFYSYWRILNGQKLAVITSKQFADRAAAEQALSLLPEQLLQRRPWIKSITAINNEINDYQDSQ